MRWIQIIATLGLVTAACGCGGKKDDPGAKATSEPRPAAPVSCPAGNVVKDGACVVVVTAEKIAAVGKQQSRLDDLARLLDQVDTVGAPIELFNGIRQLDQWKALKDKSEKFAALDAVAATLDTAVKTLRTFKGQLGEASARIGNLKGELDRLMTDTATTRKLEEVRGAVSTELRAAIEPLAAQVTDALQNAVLPLTTRLSDLSDLVITGCTMAKLSGGGDKLKELCGQAKDVFTKGVAYVDDLKARPAKMFAELSTELETQLGQLVDNETQKLVGTVQDKVNAALSLPAPGSGTGSAR